MDGKENIMDTSWLDIIMTNLLPSSPVWITVWNRGSGSGGYLYTVEANNDCGVNFLRCMSLLMCTCNVTLHMCPCM